MTVRNALQRTRLPKTFVGESKTKQADSGLCDINQIMARYRSTGQIPHLARRPPEFGDFTQATDLLTMIEQVHQAQDEFDALPARIRTYCENDPVKLAEYLAIEDNREHLVAMGLVIDQPEEGVQEPAANAEPEGENPPAGEE